MMIHRREGCSSIRDSSRIVTSELSLVKVILIPIFVQCLLKTLFQVRNTVCKQLSRGPKPLFLIITLWRVTGDSVSLVGNVLFANKNLFKTSTFEHCFSIQSV